MDPLGALMLSAFSEISFNFWVYWIFLNQPQVISTEESAISLRVGIGTEKRKHCCVAFLLVLLSSQTSSDVIWVAFKISDADLYLRE